MFGWLAVGATASVLGLLALAKKPAKGSDGIIDYRSKARLTEKAKKHTTKRSEDKVFALVLHQMGFNRGDSPSKYRKVTAHYVIPPDGNVYQLHDHTQRLPASTGLNEGSVSVEFAGNFPSRAKSTHKLAFVNPDKFGMDQLTPEQIAGGRMLVDHLVKKHKITHIYAHRQGGPKRENCPGPDIWREIGAWAVNQYDLKWGGPGWAVNAGKIKGLPIPEEWWQPPKSSSEVA